MHTIKKNNLYFKFNQLETLVFKQQEGNPAHFDLYIKGEATSEMKIATYKNSRWLFDDVRQRTVFLNIMISDRVNFRRAFKCYMKEAYGEMPTVWQCAWRKFNIRVIKAKRRITNEFYSTYVMREF